MADYIIPTIGATGFYKLSAPFDALLAENTMYTCQAIRRLGDYIALNEDPLTNIYLFYGLTETEFDADQKENMYVVSLQSEQGQWLYVPVRYLLSYPIMNGVPYKTMMLGVSLGAIPVDTDLNPLMTLLKNLIFENFGITPKVSPVALSKALLVSREDHDRIETARLLRASQKKTDYGRYQETLGQLNAALQKIQILEEFIEANFPTPTP